VKRAGTFRIAVFLYVIFNLLVIPACQPTPDTPPIVNKNDGKLEEKLEATPPPDETLKPYEAPAHWSDTVKDEKLTIEIDADVILPDVDKYPVVKLEPTAFTQQQVDDMVNYFAAGKKLYLPRVMTKSDYDEMIVDAKRGQEIDGKFVVTEESKEWLKELEEKQAAAPVDSPKIYTDTTLTYPRDYKTGEEDTEMGRNYLSVMVENGVGKDGSIYIHNYKAGNDLTGFYFSSGYDEMYKSESDYDSMMREMTEEESGWTGMGVLYDKVTLKKEDAQNAAEKVIADLDIKDMALVRADRAVSREYPDKGGYRFEYMRESGGIPGYQFLGGSWNKYERPPQYSFPFSIEQLSILVTEDGVQSFHWYECTKVLEMVNENVELLPFEDIQQRLIDQIRYKNSFGYRKDLKIYVITAELRVGYIGVKDNPNQAMLVPAWVFETETGFYSEYLKKEERYRDCSYMLNAIDGGVIEMQGPE
jgi:hypothetical protein